MNQTLSSRIDHLVYAAPDLDLAVDELEGLLGVRASAGGQHPGRGTRNALIALGPRSYLEVIGPDPSQPRPAAPRWFGIDGLTQPRLVTWAANAADVDAAAAVLARHRIGAGKVSLGSRLRSDGVTLAWRYTEPSLLAGDGLVPFFIDWQTTPHPATSTAPRVALVGLAAEHPHPSDITAILESLALPLDVTTGAEPRIVATLRTPRGDVTLR